MNWINFEESKKELPEQVVEKMIEGFSTATKDLANLFVMETTDKERLALAFKLNTRFQYKLVLGSKHLPDYSSKVIEFGYPIRLYPVIVMFPTGVFNELKEKGQVKEQTESFESEEALQQALKAVFESEYFKDVVSGLMKIARKNSELL